MKFTNIEDALKFIKENDVKFIRLGFCDLNGVQKNVAIMAGELESAFKNGVPFDEKSIEEFNGDKPLFLYPDLEALTVLPWRPSSGRVVRFFCDVKDVNGNACVYDARTALKRAINECKDDSVNSVEMVLDCEFYLFKTDENGEETKIPADNGGYLDIFPVDRCEDVRREICLTLEEMGIVPLSSRHSYGPGQNAVAFKSQGFLNAADNLQSFKTAVNSVAARNGLSASFEEKPLTNKPKNSIIIEYPDKKVTVPADLLKNPYAFFKMVSEKINDDSTLEEAFNQLKASDLT